MSLKWLNMSHLLFERVWRPLLLKVTLLIQGGRIIKYRLISYLKIEGTIIRYQPVHAVGAGVLKVEGEVKIGVVSSAFFFSSYAYIEARNSASSISIGDGTWINNGFSAIAEHSSITIGQRCLIGTNVEIMDSDFHGLELAERTKSVPARCKPVIVEDDVFLGSNVKVLKGVRIGRGSVIANSSVVTKDVPAYTVAGGNPVRVIRSLESMN